jgi:hypothetical protein
MLLSHQVWSWSNQNYSKNKVFVNIMTWRNFHLDLWPWPLSFGMMVINLLIHLYANIDVPEMENKKVEFLVKIQFLRYDVTKWRHSVNLFVDLESTNQDLSYEVLHGMVPSIQNFDLGITKFRPTARPLKVKADWIQKLISWMAGHLLLSHQVWSWSDKSYLKNKGFVDTLLWPQHDLDLWPWP